MPATRDGKTWRSQFYYEDWQGIRHKKNKRGFKTKAEAEEWERNFRQQQRKDLDINFENFVEIYFADVENRFRESTIKNKRYVFDLKVTPYFKKKKMCEIKTSDIRAWQNELIKQGYAPTYLKSINAVQQDIQEQKALEEKRQMEQMPKGSIHERLAWGARKSEMENQQRKKIKQKIEEWRDKTMKKHIYDESNGLSYTLHGDYYLPDLAVNEEEPTYGKYGMLRKQFLKMHRPARYQYLLMTGKLIAYLNRVDQEAREQVESLMKQMVEKQGVTEQLKMQNQMKWVGLMNSIKVCAEEIVLQELVYM